MLLVQLIVLLISAAILALVTGALLMLLAPPLANREPTYREAWTTMFTAHLTAGIVVIALTWAIGDTVSAAMNSLSGSIAAFAVVTTIIAYKLEASLARAALTALVLSIVMYVIALGLGVVLPQLGAA